MNPLLDFSGLPRFSDIRPEHVTLAGPGDAGLPARVELVERLGDRTFLYARLADGAEIIALDIARLPVTNILNNVFIAFSF